MSIAGWLTRVVDICSPSSQPGPQMDAFEPRMLLSADWTGSWSFKGYNTSADTGSGGAVFMPASESRTLTLTSLGGDQYKLKISGVSDTFTMTADGDTQLYYNQAGLDGDNQYLDLYFGIRKLNDNVAVLLMGSGGFESAAMTDLQWSDGVAGIMSRGSFTPTDRPWAGEYSAQSVTIEAQAGNPGYVSMDEETFDAMLTQQPNGTYYGQEVGDPQGATFSLSGSVLAADTSSMDMDGTSNPSRVWIVRGPGDTLVMIEGDAGISPEGLLTYASHSLTVLTPQAGYEYLPDLSATIGDVSSPDLLIPGDKLKVPVTISNTGAAPATGAIRLDILGSPGNNVKDASDVLLTSLNTSINIAAGSSKTFFVNVTLPPQTLPGDVWLLANVDAGNAITETNENNNLAATDGSGQVVWQFGTVGLRKNLSLTVADQAGTLTTFALTGGGAGTVTPTTDAGVGFDSVSLTDTSAASALKITPAGKATTSVNTIMSLAGSVGDGSLKSIMAPKVNLETGVDIAGLLGTLTLGDVQSIVHYIYINTDSLAVGPKAAVTITLGAVHGCEIYTGLVPIKAFTATEWSGGGSVAAPYISSWTIKGNRGMGGSWGGLYVNFDLSGKDAKGVALGKLTVAGNIEWAAINAPNGSVGAISAGSYEAGQIQAKSLASLKVNGNKAAGIVGDFAATLELTGAVKGLTLGSATIANNLTSSLWQIDGSTGSLTVGHIAGETKVTATGSLGAITVGASQNSHFLAGVSDTALDQVSDKLQFVNPSGTATIKSFTVKGWSLPKGTSYAFFQDTDLSANLLGAVKLIGADRASGGGLHALSIKSIACTETDGHKWAYPPPRGTLYAPPDGFIDLLS